MLTTHRLAAASWMGVLVVSVLGWPRAGARADVAAGQPDAPQFRQPTWAPDVYGGYATDRIIIKLRAPLSVDATAGAQGVTLARGPKATTPNAPATNAGATPAAVLPDAAWDALRAKWHVQRITRLYPHPFQHQALAVKYGLDRTYVVEVPTGTDTPVMAADFDALVDIVEHCDLAQVGSVSLIPNDASFDQLWGMHNTGQTGGTVDADIDAPEAWDIHTGDPGTVTVAVIDSGVSPHVEFGDRLIPGTNTQNPSTPDDTSDSCPHGTHVAGTVAATGNNGIGVAGVSWGALIMPVRIANGCSFNVGDLTEGIIWATEHGADICTMSLQVSFFNQALEDAVNFAHDAGVLLIAATGNNMGNFVAYPAKFENCMGVAATTDTDTHASFSNWGPEVDLAAPGVDVFSTWIGNGYTFLSGTSMATPHVSGLAALIMSYAPTMTNVQVWDVLVSSVDDVGAPGWDELFGWGRLNAFEALMQANPVGIEFTYPNGVPEVLPPGEDVTFPVELTIIGTELLDENSPKIHISVDGGPFTATPMTQTGPTAYDAVIPAQACLTDIRYFFSARLVTGDVFTGPPDAPAVWFDAMVHAGLEIVFDDDIEGDISIWTVVNDTALTAGAWEQAEPNATTWDGAPLAPGEDATPTGSMAFVTQNGAPGGAASASDVDGGPTDLISPVFDLAGGDGSVAYAYWFATTLGEPDVLTVSVSNDGGNTWILVDTVATTDGAWLTTSFRVGDFVEPTDAVVVRFRTSDVPNNSFTEAGIDDVVVSRFLCGDVQDIAILSSDPPDNARDARQPSEPDGSNPDGWQTIDLTFDGDTAGLAPADFTVSHTAGGPPPTVTSITSNGDIATVELSDIIADLAWTTITHNASATSTRIGFLPADVNEDGVSNANDILALIDGLNGVGDPLPSYKSDIDRTGAPNASDILRLIDLLNGAGVYQQYLGATLPE
ncbi:MAG: S8 family serine peptidase [Phycisphaerae bacterium]